MNAHIDYALVGGQSAGGDDAVFRANARPITFASSVDAHAGTGFLVINPADPFQRAYGHVRLGADAMDPIALNFQPRNGEHPRWRYRGLVSRGDDATERELDVHVVSYTFAGGGVRAMVIEAPPLHAPSL